MTVYNATRHRKQQPPAEARAIASRSSNYDMGSERGNIFAIPTLLVRISWQPRV